MSISAATKRLKEIALRKVLGSAREGIIIQFLIENILLCLVALVLGTILSATLLLPGFNSLITITIPFSFSSIEVMLMFFFVMLTVIGIASGAYPAFYISRFQPVHIFRGNERFGNKNLFTKILLTLQFVLAFTTVIACFVFTDNALELERKDWGYNYDNTLSLPIADINVFQGLRDKAKQNSSILGFAGSKGHIGRSNYYTSIDHLDNKFNAMIYEVGLDYLETMNIRLTEGRFFQRSKPSDITESTVVSEFFVDKMGWKEPINQTFSYDSIQYSVIGVIRDFHSKDFFRELDPVFFTLTEEENFNYASVKIAPGKLSEVDQYLRESWNEVAPNDPYDRLFQSDVFARFFDINKSNIIIIIFISAFAIILASIGLFGLLSFNITKRLKEFSVRKVLGAGRLNIIKLANKEYVWMLLISFIIGAPVGYFLMMQLIYLIYPIRRRVRMEPELLPSY